MSSLPDEPGFYWALYAFPWSDEPPRWTVIERKPSEDDDSDLPPLDWMRMGREEEETYAEATAGLIDWKRIEGPL